MYFYRKTILCSFMFYALIHLYSFNYLILTGSILLISIEPLLSLAHLSSFLAYQTELLLVSSLPWAELWQTPLDGTLIWEHVQEIIHSVPWSYPRNHSMCILILSKKSFKVYTNPIQVILQRVHCSYPRNHFKCTLILSIQGIIQSV